MNYKESTVTEATWVRSHMVRVENPFVGEKAVTFFEQEARELPDGTHAFRELGSIKQPFNNAAAMFPVIDPDTGEFVRMATYYEVYQLLSSLYINLALARDAGQ